MTWLSLLIIGVGVATLFWWIKWMDNGAETFTMDLGRINGFPKLDNKAYSAYAGILWSWSPSNIDTDANTLKLLSTPSTVWQESWTTGIKQVSIDAVNSWVKFMSEINTILMWSAADYQGQLMLLPFDPKVPTVFSATDSLWIAMYQTIWTAITPGSTWSCVVPANYNVILRFETGNPITLASSRYYNNLPYPSRLIELQVIPIAIT
jgi:hypothetical protein